MKNNSRLGIIYLMVITFLMYVPIILMIVFSFNENKSPTIWTGFSFQWYQELAADRGMREALFNSVILALGSCFFSILIATGAALGMRKRNSKMDAAISALSTLPIMIPEIILGMVFLLMFSFMNLPFGMITLLIAHTSFCIPYVFLMVRARLMDMDEQMIEAAYNLGASKRRVFFDIILPYLGPAIASGSLLSFAMSFDDVVISIFVTGARTNTLAIKIYSRVKTGVTPEINALATILIIVTACFVYLWYACKSKRNHIS